MSERTIRTRMGVIMGSVSMSRVGSLLLRFGCIQISVGMASIKATLMGLGGCRGGLWLETVSSFVDL